MLGPEEVFLVLVPGPGHLPNVEFYTNEQLFLLQEITLAKDGAGKHPQNFVTSTNSTDCNEHIVTSLQSGDHWPCYALMPKPRPL